MGRGTPSLGTQAPAPPSTPPPHPRPRGRYTALTGAPPFTAAPLSEMYQNIRAGRYPEPAHLSPNARRLIARLLAPDPAERPSLDRLLRDDFFTQVRGVRRGCRGPGSPRPVLTPGARLQRASPRTGCRPAPATAHPSLPCPSLCAGSSGRWASCCWPSAGPPGSTAPAPPAPGPPPLLPAACTRPRLAVGPFDSSAPSPPWQGRMWVADTPLLHGGPGCAPPKLLALPQAPALLTRPRIQEEVVQILTPRSGVVR